MGEACGTYVGRGKTNTWDSRENLEYPREGRIILKWILNY